MTLKERYLSLPHLYHILIWLGAGILAFGLLFYGFAKTRDAWQNHEYQKTRAADIKKAQDAEILANQEHGKAILAIQQKEEAQKQADEAHKQVLEAIGIMNDATKNTQQKREALNKITNQPIPIVSNANQSADDFCARAKELGLESTACK